jgi:hypothetical protein
MNAAQLHMASDRTRRILEDLEAVRENLLALSDDIWLGIDHNDNDAIEEGVRFKRAYNDKMNAFDELASELSSMVQEYTRVTLAEAEEVARDDSGQNERIIQELDRQVPHSIDEDFRFKRPYGFLLEGQGSTGITTWRRLFELICQQLLRRDPERFRALPENPDYISNRGNYGFSRDRDKLRSANLIGDGVYAEINLSANHICDVIRRLLDTFEIPASDLKLFLREDRDAEDSQGKLTFQD